MTVSELISILKCLKQEAEVRLYWDSGARGEVEAVYDTRDGKSVVIAGEWSIRDRKMALAEGMDTEPYYVSEQCCKSMKRERGEEP